MRTKDDGAPICRGRKRKKLTQRQLAYLTRCSHTTIYLLETGRMKTLSEDLALAIAERLEVDVEDLFEERTATVVPAVATGTQAVRNAVGAA